MSSLLDQWQQWQQDRGHAVATIHARVSRVRCAADVAHVSPEDMTTYDVAAYLATLDNDATRSTYFSHLRAWFRWLVREGYRDDDPTMRLSAPTPAARTAHPVTDSEVGTLLKTRMHRRTRMMVMLTLFQGLRPHEIAAFRGEQVDTAAKTIRVYSGARVRTSPLHPRVENEAANLPRLGYWFTTHVGNTVSASGPILARSVSDIIAEAMGRAGISGGAGRLRQWHLASASHPSSPERDDRRSSSPNGAENNGPVPRRRRTDHGAPGQSVTRSPHAAEPLTHTRPSDPVVRARPSEPSHRVGS